MDIALFKAQLHFLVTCPECDKEVLSEMPLTSVREAILSSGSLTLRSPCHSAEWAATPREMEQIREYLDAAYADAERAAESCMKDSSQSTVTDARSGQPIIDPG
jgi:hypothetical protein